MLEELVAALDNFLVILGRDCHGHSYIVRGVLPCSEAICLQMYLFRLVLVTKLGSTETVTL